MHHIVDLTESDCLKGLLHADNRSVMFLIYNVIWGHLDRIIYELILDNIKLKRLYHALVWVLQMYYSG